MTIHYIDMIDRIKLKNIHFDTNIFCYKIVNDIHLESKKSSAVTGLNFRKEITIPTLIHFVNSFKSKPFKYQQKNVNFVKKKKIQMVKVVFPFLHIYTPVTK